MKLEMLNLPPAIKTAPEPIGLVGAEVNATAYQRSPRWLKGLRSYAAIPVRNPDSQKLTALLAGAILMAGAISARAGTQTVIIPANSDTFVTCQVTGSNSNGIGDPTFLSGQATGLQLFYHMSSNCDLVAADLVVEYDGTTWIDMNSLSNADSVPWLRDEVIMIRNQASTPVTITLNGTPLPAPVAKTLASCCRSLLGSQVLGADTFENITGHPASYYTGVEVYRRSTPGTGATLPGNPPNTGGYNLYTHTATGGWSPAFPTLNAGECVYLRVGCNTVVPGIQTFVFPTLPTTTISGNVLSVSVPCGTDVTALAPTYTLSAQTTGEPPSGTPRNFTSPQTYTVYDAATLAVVETYTVTVTVDSPPVVTVNSTTACAGSPATLTATTNASNPTYSWSPGGATTASIIVSPTSTTSYTVTVTDGLTGCTATASGTVQMGCTCSGLWQLMPYSPASPIPSPRFGHAMAYDSSRFFTVMFGGQDTGFLADTWEWDGENWVMRAPPTAPTARTGHAMVYDSANSKTVLFGGLVSGGIPNGETWTWDGSTWSQLATASAPSPRSGQAMAYDSIRGKIVLFGGLDGTGRQGDTWELDVASATWTNVPPATGPSARYLHAMAYDSERHVTVLFGGDAGSINGETWTWDGVLWTQELPTYTPTPRYGHGMAFNSAGHRVTLFGGAAASSAINETWTWNGVTWLPATDLPIPGARLLSAMAYDSDRSQVVLFGGATNTALTLTVGDTWHWAHLGDDEAAPMDSEGNVIYPSNLDLTEEVIVEDVFNRDKGYVADLYPEFDTSLGTWLDKYPCEPSIGGTVPLEASNPDLQSELTDPAFTGVTPAEITATLRTWEDQIVAMTNLETIQLSTAPPATGPYTNQSTPHCVTAGANYAFGGRDIVFVMGFEMSQLLDKMKGVPSAQASWHQPTSFPGSTQNPQFYGPDLPFVSVMDRETATMGYYKRQAFLYWKDHIHRFLELKGYKNRYLIVAWSTNDRLELGAQAVLTQIGDAMRYGTGVVNPLYNDRTKFGTPSYVIISHSTGGPVTDVAMASAANNSNLGAQFIPDHCKVHLASHAAFGGSSLATAVGIASGFVTNALPEWLCPLEKLFVPLLTDRDLPACPIFENTVAQSVLVDLVPRVMQTTWGKDYLDKMPVPTLTMVGGHASWTGPVKYLLQPGFDDGVVTINSQLGNPNGNRYWPSGFVPNPPFARNTLYDMGVAFHGNLPALGLDSPHRANRYYIDQVIDRTLSDESPLRLVAGGAMPNYSPTGMIQPVGNQFPLSDCCDPPGYNPLRRYSNHFSFLQSAADHNEAAIGPWPEGPADYKFTHNDERNIEETLVITNPQVYAPRPMPYVNDGQPLLTVSGVPKLKEIERGRKVTFKIRILGKKYSKSWWIWKRNYHLLEGWENKVEFDYVYDSVLSVPNHTANYTCSFDADQDADGSSNLLELAFGMNPNVSDSVRIELTGGILSKRGIPTLLPTNNPGGEEFLGLFGRRKTYLADGLTYTAQFSGDLSNWEDNLAIPAVIADDGEIEAVTVPCPLLANGLRARFFRVRITTLPLP